MISSADQPLRCWLTMSDCRKTPQPMASARHRLGLERALGVALERDVVALGHALQERAVARRALRVQTEVGHRALAQDHDLDVGAAHVADHVRVREEVQRGGGVGHRLDDADVGAEHVLQQILAVAGERERADVRRSRPRAPGGTATCASSIGLPLRQRVAGEAAARGPSESTTALAVVLPKSQPSSTGADVLRARRPRHAAAPRSTYSLTNVARSAGVRRPGPARLPWPSARAGPSRSTTRACRVPGRRRRPASRPGRSRCSRGTRSRAPPAGTTMSVGGLAAGRDRSCARVQSLRQVMAPGLLQALEEQVRAAEQQHLGRRRVALGQRGEVLVDHRLEQAGDDLLDRHAGLHQRVGVGLGEDPALAS